MSLGKLDPAKAIPTLVKMFDAGKTGPFIEEGSDGASVIVRGSKDQIEEVVVAINAMQGGGIDFGTPGKVRVIPVEKGNATNLAKAIQKTYKLNNRNPVKVIVPGLDSGDEDRPKAKDAPPAIGPVKDKDVSKAVPAPAVVAATKEYVPGSGKGAGDAVVVPVVLPAAFGDDKKAPTAPAEAKKDDKPLVTILALGGQIVVSSEDGEVAGRHRQVEPGAPGGPRRRRLPGHQAQGRQRPRGGPHPDRVVQRPAPAAGGRGPRRQPVRHDDGTHGHGRGGGRAAAEACASASRPTRRRTRCSSGRRSST